MLEKTGVFQGSVTICERKRVYGHRKGVQVPDCVVKKRNLTPQTGCNEECGDKSPHSESVTVVRRTTSRLACSAGSDRG